MAAYRRVYDMRVCRCGPVGGGGSPPPSPWLCMLSPAGWLPRVRDQLRPLTLDYEYGKNFTFISAVSRQGVVPLGSFFVKIVESLSLKPERNHDLQRRTKPGRNIVDEKKKGMKVWNGQRRSPIYSQVGAYGYVGGTTIMGNIELSQGYKIRPGST